MLSRSRTGSIATRSTGSNSESQAAAAKFPEAGNLAAAAGVEETETSKKGDGTVKKEGVAQVASDALAGGDAGGSQPCDDDDVPDWLRGCDAAGTCTEPGADRPATPEPPDWLRD